MIDEKLGRLITGGVCAPFVSEQIAIEQDYERKLIDLMALTRLSRDEVRITSEMSLWDIDHLLWYAQRTGKIRPV